MVPVSHDLLRCRAALEGAAGPVVLDLETTGLRRFNQIVSAGLLVEGVAHVLFARSGHAGVANLPLPLFREALRPLERKDLAVVAHNAPFDLGFLRREGVRVGGEVRDTLKLLRLVDQDRGAGRDDSGRHPPRADLRAADDAPRLLDYKLKHVARQLLGLKMPGFPGAIELAPYAAHATYLASDLLGTRALYDYLWPRLSDGEREYYRGLVAPLIPVLLDMSELGVQADPAFIESEGRRLDDLLGRLSREHQARFGVGLGMDQGQLTDWLYQSLRLPVLRRRKAGKRRMPSLDGKTLQALEQFTEDEGARGSLRLIQDYRQAAGLLVRLRSLTKHIDRRAGRIHSSFDDRQSSGRIASTHPNLQQLARARVIRGEEFRSRNALRATDGYELAVFDIAQADIRVLAHAVESFPLTARQLQADLRRRREELLGPALREFAGAMERQANPGFAGQPAREPDFDPAMPADLAEDFRRPEDFYTTAAARILGRQPKDKAERNKYKAVILSIVNGLGPPSLARTLGVGEQQARRFLADFERAYPKVAAYKRMMYWQIAHTGQTTTFLGRPRTVTAHRWLVAEPRVEMLVSYRHGDAYWLDVVPLRPGLRVLTTYVRRAWNARTGRLIYDAQRGRLTPRRYGLFEAEALQYTLPVRNWGWRSIRRVRARGEEARYEGFDATARSAFNFICQGGTADVSKRMMLRGRAVCDRFGARLLIQIHDELVFEVPRDRTRAFLGVMKKVLEEPPTPDFRVPMKVEPKRGPAFGALVTVDDADL
jgi:DNA polymerase I-like protein with 3'-5' exonuclease and polymerase domains